MAEIIERAKSSWNEAISMLGLASLSGLSADELAMANAAVRALESSLKQSGGLFSSRNYVVFGKSCVQAAEDRGLYVSSALPTAFTIISVTHVTKLHTYNAMFFRSQSGASHYWLFDTYVFGIPNIRYTGTSLPRVLYHQTENKTYYGGRPGKWW
jgi:hypothetical protein